MSSTARKRKRDEDSKDLDEQERRLLAQFCAIQAAINFVGKKQSIASLKTVIQVANGILSSQRPPGTQQCGAQGKDTGGNIDLLTVENIKTIVNIAPELFKFYHQGIECSPQEVLADISTADSAGDVSITVVPPNASQYKAKERKQQFIQSLRKRGKEPASTATHQRSRKSHAAVSTGESSREDSSENTLRYSSKPEQPPKATFSNIESFLQNYTPAYSGQIVHVENYIDRKSEHCDIPSELGETIINVLKRKGISSIYQHQKLGIDSALEGKHIVVSTSTSSGKSLIYSACILNGLLAEPSRVALCLFPTKALAQDQLRSFLEFRDMDSRLQHAVRPACLDGDVSWKDRRRICKESNLILSNPDIFHCSILPSHSSWKRIISNLRYVVIDEAHVYKGVFGAHVAHVLRRLVRLCELYGSCPQFFCCSATIGNPVHHFKKLISVNDDTELVDNEKAKANDVMAVVADTSPLGRKKFIVWNPPLLSENNSGTDSNATKQHNGDKRKTGRVTSPAKHMRLPGGRSRREPERKIEEYNIYALQEHLPEQNDNSSGFLAKPNLESLERTVNRNMAAQRSPILETAEIFSTLIAGGMRTIVFGKVRTVVELLLQYSTEYLRKMSPKSVELVKAYRGGYVKEDRREIEKELFAGKLQGVIATNALELGVDIGCLDAVVLLGCPNSSSSLWQQAGRAGRSGKDAIIVLVTYDSPIDQYFVKDPKYMLSRPPEEVILDIENASILRQHVICAAVEHPLFPQDTKYFGSKLGSVVKDLRKNGMLIPANRGTEGGKKGDVSAWTAAPWICNPSTTTTLRSVDNIVYQVFDVTQPEQCLDEIDESRAYYQVHEGAIYMNQGRTYQVIKLDTSKKKVLLRRAKVNYYTRTRDHRNVQSLKRHRSSASGHTHFGPVQVESWVYGYRKFSKLSGKPFEVVDLNLPPIEYFSYGIWHDVTLKTKRYLDNAGLDFLGGCHAASHAVSAVVSLFISCDRSDMGTECAYPFQERARPVRFLVHDTRPGGIGISDAIFRKSEELFKEALKLVSECSCNEGCPRCVLDEQCTEHNYVIDKQAAIVILREACYGELLKKTIG